MLHRLAGLHHVVLDRHGNAVEGRERSPAGAAASPRSASRLAARLRGDGRGRCSRGPASSRPSPRHGRPGSTRGATPPRREGRAQLAQGGEGLGHPAPQPASSPSITLGHHEGRALPLGRVGDGLQPGSMGGSPDPPAAASPAGSRGRWAPRPRWTARRALDVAEDGVELAGHEPLGLVRAEREPGQLGDARDVSRLILDMGPGSSAPLRREPARPCAPSTPRRDGLGSGPAVIACRRLHDRPQGFHGPAPDDIQQGIRRPRLVRAHAGPGEGDPRDAQGRRPDRPGPHRQRQDGRLRHPDRWTDELDPSCRAARRWCWPDPRAGQPGLAAESRSPWASTRRALPPDLRRRRLRQQIDAIEAGAHVIVGTPGPHPRPPRAGPPLLRRRAHVVFDEADELLSLGFWPDMREIRRSYLPESASPASSRPRSPRRVRSLSRVFLTSPSSSRWSEGHSLARRRSSTSSS